MPYKKRLQKQFPIISLLPQNALFHPRVTAMHVANGAGGIESGENLCTNFHSKGLAILLCFPMHPDQENCGGTFRLVARTENETGAERNGRRIQETRLHKRKFYSRGPLRAHFAAASVVQ